MGRFSMQMSMQCNLECVGFINVRGLQSRVHTQTHMISGNFLMCTFTQIKNALTNEAPGVCVCVHAENVQNRSPPRLKETYAESTKNPFAKHKNMREWFPNHLHKTDDAPVGG